MAVIDFEAAMSRRRIRRAKGQMAALAQLREEVAGSGFALAASLLELAIAAIDQQLKEGAVQPPPNADQ